MTEWYNSNSIGVNHPLETDTTSSPTTVYQRRNFTSEINEDGNTSWHYEERTMTHEEYQSIQIVELQTQIDDILVAMVEV